MVETTTLYRPVGAKELKLIEDSDFTAFPPRLPEQPIFYPVLSEAYATQIARDWNARFNEDKVGYVTRFEVAIEYLGEFEVQCVGGDTREEYWIPAEDLERFNQNIVGKIDVILEFRGEYCFFTLRRRHEIFSNPFCNCNCRANDDCFHSRPGARSKGSCCFQ